MNWSVSPSSCNPMHWTLDSTVCFTAGKTPSLPGGLCHWKYIRYTTYYTDYTDLYYRVIVGLCHSCWNLRDQQWPLHDLVSLILKGLVVPEFARIPGPEKCYEAKTVVEAHNLCAGDPYFPFVSRHNEHGEAAFCCLGWGVLSLGNMLRGSGRYWLLRHSRTSAGTPLPGSERFVGLAGMNFLMLFVWTF